MQDIYYLHVCGTYIFTSFFRNSHLKFIKTILLWKKETLEHCCWMCKLVQALWRTVWRCLKKVKIKLPYDPAIPFLGIYPETMKTLIQKDICILVFKAELFIIVKRHGSNQMSINRWMDREVFYIFMHICMYMYLCTYVYVYIQWNIMLYCILELTDTNYYT